MNAAFSTARIKIEQQLFKLFYSPYEPLSTSVQDRYLKDITTFFKLSRTDESVNWFQLFNYIKIIIIINYFIDKAMLRVD